MLKTGSLFALSFLCFSACSQDIINTVDAGNTRVRIVESRIAPYDSGIVFINLHENENTSVQAANIYMATRGGRLVRLHHSGKRNIEYKLGKKFFAIDPNRMFTDVGRKESLTALSTYSKGAVAAILPVSNFILNEYILNKQLIVALHNNTDSAFSILSYTEPAQEGENAERVFMSDAMDPDDFILTTDGNIFEQLQQLNINAVLQSINAKDDGSLSIYTQQKGIAYINVEAEHGHLNEQLQLLEALNNIIEKRIK